MRARSRRSGGCRRGDLGGCSAAGRRRPAWRGRWARGGRAGAPGRGCSPRAPAAGARPRHPCWASQPRTAAPPRDGSPPASSRPAAPPRLGRKTPRGSARVGREAARSGAAPSGPGVWTGLSPRPLWYPQVCGMTRGAPPFVSSRALPGPSAPHPHPHPRAGRPVPSWEPFLLQSLRASGRAGRAHPGSLFLRFPQPGPRVTSSWVGAGT